ncbi:MAG TPA: AI-2E family transporter [Anaerolineaceae bacterium]|nr:AI-2E family transporter [Anaerolineaceae bacterium]
MKHLARNVAIVLLTLAVLLLLWQIRTAVVLFLLSLWFAGTARPVVDRLSEDRINRGLAILLVYLIVLAIIAGLFVAVGPTLLAELQQLTDRFVSTYTAIWNQWPQGSIVQQFIIEQLPRPEQLYTVLDPETQNPVMEGVLGFLFGSVSLIGQVFLAIVLSVYWTADRVRFERLWLSLLPAETRMRARTIYRQVEEGVGAYTRSILIQALAAGILLGVGYALLGVPYPALLALGGAISWLIPWVGLVITILLAAAASLPFGIGLVVLAALVTIVVYVALLNFIEPRLFPRERFSLLFKLILVIALGSEYGLIGIITAPPLAAALQLIGRNVTRKPVAALNQETIRQIADLNRHVETVEQLLVSLPAAEVQPIENILSRLNDLIGRAKELIDEEGLQAGPSIGSENQPVPGRVPTR